MIDSQDIFFGRGPKAQRQKTVRHSKFHGFILNVDQSLTSNILLDRWRFLHMFYVGL